jgi:hypothetical protein
MRSYILQFLCGATIVGNAIASPSSRIDTRTTDVKACLQTHGITFFDNSSADWANISKPFILRCIFTPLVIVDSTTEPQVTDAVNSATGVGLRVQAKGGGHSYASFSRGGQDGSVIIDMRHFKTIELDQGKSYQCMQDEANDQRLGSQRSEQVRNLETLPQNYLHKDSEHYPTALALVSVSAVMPLTEGTVTLGDYGVSHWTISILWISYLRTEV